MAKYYSLDRILKNDASYYMVVGERSNGKTYASLKHGLTKFFKDGSQIGYIRRWGEDIKGRTGATIFDALIANGEIEKLSNGKWNGVYYYSGRYYLTKVNKDGTSVKSLDPFAYAFALSEMEHYKSSSYPWIRTIIFDEFLSRTRGLGDDEFVLFMNMLSTIIRDPSRDDVEIFMLANTVNWDSIYFKEFGIDNIRQMEQGTIDVYQYGNSKCSLAIEYCESRKTRESEINDRYFAFNNPRLKMITEGAWEMDIYPHCPCKYKPENVVFSYFINYNDELLQADVINGGYEMDEDNRRIKEQDNVYFTFIHRKTTPINDEDEDLIFSNVHSPKYNQRLNMFKPTDNLGRNIKQFFTDNRVFYQDNVVGEIVNNYMIWCSTV